MPNIAKENIVIFTPFASDSWGLKYTVRLRVLKPSLSVVKYSGYNFLILPISRKYEFKPASFSKWKSLGEFATEIAELPSLEFKNWITQPGLNLLEKFK